MSDTSDMVLIREYADRSSEPAFAGLVHRHINLVHSVALRYAGNFPDAQDIAQAVFVILAKKADHLRHRTTLAGWLYETTRFTAARLVRTRARQQAREQEAYMQSTSNDSDTGTVWGQLAPLLEEAMSRLSEKERALLALRFFENKTAAETAALLGIREAAAHKRGARALEKLRRFFHGRGIASTTTAIAGAISAHSMQAAPAALAKSLATVAVSKGAAVGASTLTLVKGTLKLMAWAKAKTAIVIGAGLLLAAGTATVAVVEIEKPPAPVAVAQADNPPAYPWQAEAFTTNAQGGKGIKSDVLEKAPRMVDIRPTIRPVEGYRNETSVATSPDEVVRLGTGCTVQRMLMSAYGFSMTDCRTVVATPLPPDQYDYIDNFSHGATQAFKDAITRKFGVTGRVVAMETNVLILRVKNPNAPGLRPSKPGGSNTESSGPNSGESHTAGQDFINWVNYCERTMQIPIVDKTGLTGKYDTDLKWQWGRGQSEKDAFQQAVLDQLGLELAPGREKINILIIEKSTKPISLSPSITYETNPPPIRPGQVDFPKASWAFAGYASPKAALETYFWAMNRPETTNFEASMTPGARENFTKTLQNAGKAEDQFFKELAPILKKISGYRVLETNASDALDFQIAIEGGVNKSDRMRIRMVGTEWKVDEIPLHFCEPKPQPIAPRQVYSPKASWAFAGYASPEAALQTYFWAMNKQDTTNLYASMTPGAREEFTKGQQDAGQTEAQFFRELAPVLKKFSGYRILEIQPVAADEFDLIIAIEDGPNKSDNMTVKRVGTEWKVDEIPD